MKVTIFQTDVLWGNPDGNVQRAQELLAEHPGAYLYVLPEMWATGFATCPQDIAEDEDESVALLWMRRAAAANDCAVCGSLAVRIADGSYRNRQYFVTKDEVVTYDKHHLFTYGHEDSFITPGDKSVVVDYRGHRFLLLTCYDLRFPVWSRYGRAGEYDAIIVVANWPESRQLPWRVLTRARAIENQCYLIGCNRVGDDEKCHYAGESLICDARGETLASCPPNEPSVCTAELDFEALSAARSRFRVLEDRDF